MVRLRRVVHVAMSAAYAFRTWPDLQLPEHIRLWRDADHRAAIRSGSHPQPVVDRRDSRGEYVLLSANRRSAVGSTRGAPSQEASQVLATCNVRFRAAVARRH